MLLALMFAIPIEYVAYVNRDLAEPKQHFRPRDQVPFIKESLIEAKLNFIKQKTSNVDLIVIGDSSGLMGVDARILSDETGHQTYNLSTFAWHGVEGHRLLLESFVENHGPPSIVVYYFAPIVMARVERLFKEEGHQSRLRQQLSRERYLLPSMNFREIAQRWTVPERLAQSLVTGRRGRYPSHNEMLVSLAKSHGSMKETSRMEWRSAPILAGDISSYQLESLRRLVEMAHEHKFELFLICNPLPEIARTDRNREFMRHLESRFLEVSQDHSQVHVYRPFARYYPNESCALLNHIHPDAIPRNTKEIAAWLSEEYELSP